MDTDNLLHSQIKHLFIIKARIICMNLISNKVVESKPKHTECQQERVFIASWVTKHCKKNEYLQLTL